jgi:DNA-binding NarL/FixJ family response regulator
LVRHVFKRWSEVRFIVISSHFDSTLPGELIALGVAGFIDKAAPVDHAVRAIERVLAGGIYYSANVRPLPALRLESQEGPWASILTKRERVVAGLVADGMISKEIAKRLNLSARTVEKERVQLMAKLGVRDLPGLIRWCVRHGLV